MKQIIRQKRITTLLSCMMLLSIPMTDALAKSPAKQEQIIVGLANVVQEKMPQTYNTFGTLTADKIVTISPSSDGRITKIYFKNGQLVEKGTPIIQMDDTDAKADVATKQADLNLAITTYQRHKQLFAYGGTTKQSLDQLAADVKNDKIAVTNSNILLEKLTLKAPFDGQLGEFSVQAGDYVSAGDALVTLLNKAPIIVNYSLPQELITKLKIGQKVVISTQSIKKKTFNGQVSFISPAVDAATGTFNMEATLPNKDGSLAPGMFVQVLQTIGDTDNALVIPDVALLSDIEGNYVYRVVDHKVARTNVTIGTIKDGKVEIIKGLKLGQAVITQGQQKVSDGEMVETVLDSGFNPPANRMG